MESLKVGFDTDVMLYKEDNGARNKQFRLFEAYQVTPEDPLIINKIASWTNATGLTFSAAKDVLDRRSNLMGTTIVAPVIQVNYCK